MDEKIFTPLEKQYLRSYFSKKDAALGIELTTNPDLRAEFAAKLQEAAGNAQRDRPTWSALFGSMIGSLSVGALIAQLAFPGTLVVATRGEGTPNPGGAAYEVLATDSKGDVGSLDRSLVYVDQQVLPRIKVIEAATVCADEVIIDRQATMTRVRVFFPDTDNESCTQFKKLVGIEASAKGWRTFLIK